MLSLDKFIDRNNDEEIINFDKDISFKTFKIYSDNKIFKINEAVDILFSKNILNFNKKVIILLEMKKEEYKR